MVSPNSKICGSTHMTRKMEISVPVPRYMPMAEMVSLEVIKPMTIPAEASMVPEVMMVGKAWFNVSTMASRRGICSFSSI